MATFARVLARHGCSPTSLLAPHSLRDFFLHFWFGPAVWIVDAIEVGRLTSPVEPPIPPSNELRFRGVQGAQLRRSRRIVAQV